MVEGIQYGGEISSIRWRIFSTHSVTPSVWRRCIISPLQWAEGMPDPASKLQQPITPAIATMKSHQLCTAVELKVENYFFFTFGYHCNIL